jgi:hypothetical protein
MECYICLEGDARAELVILGCACAAYAHVECMARFARAAGSWRECRTCKRKITGRMLHMLCGHPTGTGHAVCNIHALLAALDGAGIVCARPVNDQTCVRVRLPEHGPYRALSIAALAQGFEAALVDSEDRVVGAVGAFGADEIPRLVRHIRSVCSSKRA